MKNVLILIAFLTASFTATADIKPVHEIQKVLLKALNDKHLDSVFDREECGDFYPFHLVTNELIDQETVTLLKKKFNGTAKSKSDVKSLRNDEILELESISIGINKSSLDFNYNDKKLRIRLQKEGENWKVYSVKVSGKGIFSFYYDA